MVKLDVCKVNDNEKKAWSQSMLSYFADNGAAHTDRQWKEMARLLHRRHRSIKIGGKTSWAKLPGGAVILMGVAVCVR